VSPHVTEVAIKITEPLLAVLKQYRYAPGNYMNFCWKCGEQFQGDKLASTCCQCALEEIARQHK
jgi:predicted Zn-ribbon and HTH transcriptional regulator